MSEPVNTKAGPQRFRKKPVVIEAMQYTSDPRSCIAVHEFIGLEEHDDDTDACGKQPFFIDTLEGLMEVSVGDWVIRGVEGEIYPCKPSIFAATYEAARDE